MFRAKANSFDAMFFLATCRSEMRNDMIELTRMNGQTFLLNADLIETVEEVPDTVITTTTGRKFFVKESRQNVKNLVKCYKREIYCGDILG